MSEVKVNKISPKTACGTVTLGDSGDTIAIGAGVTTSGMGRTGTVDWVTTIKTDSDSPITAVSGKGYFLNTTAAAITINLPTSPSAGDIVSIKDYARTFATYNVTVGRGGSNMDGNANDTTLLVDGLSVTFIYMDASKGWGFINDDATSAAGTKLLIATVSGACNTLETAPDCANAKIATFVGPGTFCVSQVHTCTADNLVSYMVAAGGGSGGSAQYNGAGGGGAGGFRELVSPVAPYTASPLEGYSTVPNRVTVTATGYPITVGGGGASVTGNGTDGNKGNDSIFSTITSTGGGFGSAGNAAPAAGPGGSGGGAGGGGRSIAGGTGNTPPTTPSQGFAGGTSPAPPVPSDNAAGGGGGATAVGTPGAANSGVGGDGATTSISAAAIVRGGGGGGSGNCGPAAQAAGGTGGGGAGGPPGGNDGVAGTVNTGGGGGGASGEGAPGGNDNSGQGGSGVVIIRYKFQ